jgi:intermembrane space import and assembly protein 40
MGCFVEGVVLPNGKINWNCPCLGNMASGPCAVQFRSAFSCFHYSVSDVKGIECISEFDKLQACMKNFPSLFKTDKNTKNDSQ